LKALLNKKKSAFWSGDKEELKKVQKDLKYKIREGKECFRRKMENQLQQKNVREVWRNMKKISGHFQDNGGATLSAGRGWANDLNLFFNRFDNGPLITSPTPQLPTTKPAPPPTPAQPHIYFTADQVRNQLKRTKARKAAGPDGICSRLLRDCADQLCQVALYIFNLSLSLERVPELWKTSCVVPVPKIAHPREPSHFRPVALTSHLMKTMERLILHHLRPL
ncbi:unnamed protein product, partial [Oreochromis niloticus]